MLKAKRVCLFRYTLNESKGNGNENENERNEYF